MDWPRGAIMSAQNGVHARSSGPLNDNLVTSIQQVKAGLQAFNDLQSHKFDIMRGMNLESVDLIYPDPPFNSKTNDAARLRVKLLVPTSRILGHYMLLILHG